MPETDEVASRVYEHIPSRNGKSSGFSESYVFRQRTPRARKDYHCHCCDEPIPRGTRHVMYVTTNQEAPGFEAWRIHGECHIEGLNRLDGEERPKWRWLGPEGR